MDILQEQVDALVNPVNCVGVMGKGLALEFKTAFPKNFSEYEKACRLGQVVPGKMFVTSTGLKIPKYIINFPTKQHWKNPSRMEWIKEGLANLVTVVMDKGIESLAMPAIGCGLGGLDWRKIEPEIRRTFSYIPGNSFRFVVYDPNRVRTETIGRPKEKLPQIDIRA